MKLPSVKGIKWNYLALAFAVPVLCFLFLMLVAGYAPFGKYSMLYSDCYHQYFPFFKAFRNALSDLLPSGMIPVMVALSEIDPEKQANSITKAERERLLRLFKAFPIPLSAFRPISEAIITRGGVSVSEVNPKTMQSKLIQGLHFAGEVLDLDAYTGGFNLHIAFSTAVVAAEAAALDQ